MADFENIRNGIIQLFDNSINKLKINNKELNMNYVEGEYCICYISCFNQEELNVLIDMINTKLGLPFPNLIYPYSYTSLHPITKISQTFYQIAIEWFFDLEERLDILKEDDEIEIEFLKIIDSIQSQNETITKIFNIYQLEKKRGSDDQSQQLH